MHITIRTVFFFMFTFHLYHAWWEVMIRTKMVHVYLEGSISDLEREVYVHTTLFLKGSYSILFFFKSLNSYHRQRKL